MKLLITGSRKFDNSIGIMEAIKQVENLQGQKITMLLHGGAKGADTLAENWAKENGIKTKVLKPDYEKHLPKQAPLIRNIELVKLAEVTLALYTGNERTGGTGFTATQSIKAGKPLYEKFQNGKLKYTAPASKLF